MMNLFLKIVLKNSLNKCLQVILLISINILVSAQNINISKKTEIVNIHNDTLFTTETTVLINGTKGDGFYPIFYDGKLEKVSDIKVYEKKAKSYKRIKDLIIRDENLNPDIISSQKIKYIFFPSESEVKINYTITCNELKYFSGLRLFSYYQSDTFDFYISVPKTYRLSYDIIYRDSLSFLSIDSLNQDSQTLYQIKAIPVKVEPDPLMHFGIYKDVKLPLMRIVIIPTEEAGNKIKSFNDWYLQKVETTRGFDSVTKNKIDEITDGITDHIEIINVLYEYVKTNFKYVAIEIGMGAFIPSHTNEVFTNKQGDCKDLSNFLSEALNYKGIESYIALAATYHHISDCNFPSLSSANHIICVAYLNDKPILLDPTDPVHVLNTPVQDIQERTILIINPNGGKLHKLARFEAQNNQVNYNISMKSNAEKSLLQGEFTVDYSGLSGNYFKHMYLLVDEDEKSIFNKKHYETVFHNQSVDELIINNSVDEISVYGKLTANMNLFVDKDKRFLYLDFLPRLFENVESNKLIEGTFLGSTISRKVKLSIKMDEPFERFQPIIHSFNGEGVSLDITISCDYESVIKYDYELMVDHLFVNKENQLFLNEVLNSFNKITKEPLILKNKK